MSAAGPGPGVQRLNSGSVKHEDMNLRRGGSFARRPERRPLVADGKRQRACEARGRDPRLGRLARRIQLAAPRRSPWRPAARGLVRQRSAPAGDALRRGTFGGSGKSATQKRQRSRTPRRERAGPPTRSATPEPGGVSLLPLRGGPAGASEAGDTGTRSAARRGCPARGAAATEATHGAFAANVLLRDEPDDKRKGIHEAGRTRGNAVSPHARGPGDPGTAATSRCGRRVRVRVGAAPRAVSPPRPRRPPTPRDPLKICLSPLAAFPPCRLVRPHSART